MAMPLDSFPPFVMNRAGHLPIALHGNRYFDARAFWRSRIAHARQEPLTHFSD